MSIEPTCASSLARNTKGTPYPSHANVVFILQHDPTFAADRIWYDEFLDRVFLANSPTREWRDDDDTRVTVDIQDRFGMHGLSKYVVRDAVEFIARQRTRHVIRDWVNGIAWDGVPRIAHAFSDYWGASDDEYTIAASRNFFIGIAARIERPGCKLDTMVVFEGPQGIKKSMALEVLGGEWYSISNETVGSKDFLQGLRGQLIIEMAELQSLAKADVRAIKQTLSSPHDDYRKSHGYNMRKYPRECIFVGTTNVMDWGNDETGLRRFWPIQCGEIHIDLLRASRAQLFAEAVAAFRSGATWWEMPASTLGIQSDRQQRDEWTSTVLDWCALQIDDGIALVDIATKALKLEIGRVDKGVQMRISRILKLAQWERKKRREGESTRWLWYKEDTSSGNNTVGGNGGNEKFLV